MKDKVGKDEEALEVCLALFFSCGCYCRCCSCGCHMLQLWCMWLPALTKLRLLFHGQPLQQEPSRPAVLRMPTGARYLVRWCYSVASGALSRRAMLTAAFLQLLLWPDEAQGPPHETTSLQQAVSPGRQWVFILLTPRWIPVSCLQEREQVLQDKQQLLESLRAVHDWKAEANSLLRLCAWQKVFDLEDQREAS